jgi:AraC-like DNA-binding protein
MPFSAYDMECITKAKALIDKDISRHLSIDDIAASAGIGSTKLKKGFKEQYGFGLFTYLRQQRMEMAAILLSTTNKPLKLIAKTTGFHYTSNFNSAFKHFHQCSPAQYRNRLKNK